MLALDRRLLCSAAALAGAVVIAVAEPVHAQRLTGEAGPGSTVPLLSPSAPDAESPASQPAVLAVALKQEALETARRVAEAYPQDPLAYALLGSAFYNTGNSDEATRHLQKCLELSPGQTGAYEVLARIAYEKGKLEESIRLCQEATKQGTPNQLIMNRLGRALMDLGRTEEAVQALQQATKATKPSSESYYLLGQAQLQAGAYAQARESFLHATALTPDHTQAFFGLYTACMRLGQTNQANEYRDQFQKLEAADRQMLTDRSSQEDTLTGLPLVRKTVARSLFGAAQVYRGHKESAKAAELFRRSALLDAESSVYRAALQAHYAQENQLTEAAAAFQQLVEAQPNNPLNYLFLGRVQNRLEQLDAAEQAYEKVKELAPNWPEGYRALAELYLRGNRKLHEARTLAQQAVKLEPSAANYYLFAVACIQNEDLPSAIEAMTQAVSLKPEEQRYQELLKKLKARP